MKQPKFRFDLFGSGVTSQPATQTPQEVPTALTTPQCEPAPSWYCVPTALANLTGLTQREATALLAQELGDVPIEGVFYPTLLKVLVSLGFGYREVSTDYRKHNYSKGQMYLIVFRGHVGIIKNCKYIDTYYRNGIELSRSPVRRVVETNFLIWKQINFAVSK